jgi:hypothetical protein
MYYRVVKVTPQMAEEWLKKNVNFRILRNSVVERYARDMINGTWRLNPADALVFDTVDHLTNGQHRLNGVIVSGVTVEFVVCFGADLGSDANFDEGTARSLGDRLANALHEDRAMQREVAVIRMMISGGTRDSSKFTSSEIKDFYSRHKEAIGWAIRQFAVARAMISHAAVVGAFARAYYVAMDRKQLEAFAAGLYSGLFPASMDQGRILRNWMMRIGGTGNCGAKLRRDFYLRVEYALNAYLTGKRMDKCLAASGELFPFKNEA